MSSPTSPSATHTSPLRAGSGNKLAATAPAAAVTSPPSARPARPVPGKDPDADSFESQLRAQKKAHENAELEKAKGLELQRRREANISRLSKQLEEEKRRSELEITLMKGLRTPGKVSITIKCGKDIRSREVGRSLDLYVCPQHHRTRLVITAFVYDLVLPQILSCVALKLVRWYQRQVWPARS
jgi:hypothetical protein